MPGARTGGDKLAMLFTCTVCDTRSGKIMTKVRNANCLACMATFDICVHRMHTKTE